jgi:hypothetical protein
VPFAADLLHVSIDQERRIGVFWSWRSRQAVKLASSSG